MAAALPAGHGAVRGLSFVALTVARRALQALDSFATTATIIIFAFDLSTNNPTEDPELVLILVISHMLIRRAALVPRTARRSLVLGLVAAAAIVACTVVVRTKTPDHSLVGALALGAVGCYLLTGTHVFPGESAFEVLAAHVHKDPEPPSARLGAPLPDGLGELVLRCLREDVRDRPQSAGELLAALEALPLVWRHADAEALGNGATRMPPRQRRDLVGALARFLPGNVGPKQLRFPYGTTAARRARMKNLVTFVGSASILLVSSVAVAKISHTEKRNMVIATAETDMKDRTQQFIKTFKLSNNHRQEGRHAVGVVKLLDADGGEVRECDFDETLDALKEVKVDLSSCDGVFNDFVIVLSSVDPIAPPPADGEGND